MAESSSSSWVLPERHESDSHTDGIDLASLTESGLTQSFRSTTAGLLQQRVEIAVEANIILIAHPEGKRLGSRFRLPVGTTLEVGRDPESGVSLPEVLSVSRRHAAVRYSGRSVTIEDLGSTNGTYVNGQLARGRVALKSGDRFQVAAVHFKFLHEQDVEHAYYEAISDLVMRDGLTEVFNKRKFEEELEREWARSRRYNRPLSLLVVDLDDFKSINDNYGHLCGDFVLKQVASVVRESLRPEQLIARIGGDEFAVICPETDGEGAAALAERLLEGVAALDYHYCDLRIPVACSVGAAQRTPEMTGHHDLYEAADRALYASKRGGRNRAAAVEDEPLTS